MHTVRSWLWLSVLLLGVIVAPTQAQLRPLAWYRLGEEDTGATVGASIDSTVESFGGLEMSTFGTVLYSDETPPLTTSTMSALFDGDFENYLSTDATPWHSQLSGSFRVGMEAWIKPDPELEGMVSVPFGNGSGYWLSIGDDGFFHAHAGPSTPAGITPVKYGEWQHVAFWTTGTYWQVYVDGVAQYDPAGLPSFNYGSPSGYATIGADRDGFSEYKGLVDEMRVFTWAGAFNPAELLYFTLRNQGDVNEDGLVNQADYDIWRANVGADLTGLTLLDMRGRGDLNGNRRIDLDDFAVIKANLSPGVALTVPEPSSSLLLLLGLGLSALKLRRRGQ